jgi:O-antigen biosynthesis protein
MTHLSLSSLDSKAGFIPIVLTPDGRVEDATGTDLSAERDKWVVIAPSRLRLHPGFQEIVREEGHRRPDIDLFYGDEVAPGAENVDHAIILKPELDITLIVADDYVGYPLLVRASAMRRLGGLRPTANTAASYDLVLRALSAGLGIARITQTLAAHDQARPRPHVTDRRAALCSWLAESASPFDIGDGLVPGTLRLQRRFASFPDVTLLIPTKQSAHGDHRGTARQQPYIIDLLKSIPDTNWPIEKLHIVIGDDIGADRIYAGLRCPFDVRRIITGGPCHQEFNYAEKINRLWRAADTEQIVIMNDDTVVQSADWLQALLTFSMEDDVGVVGARLLYPNGRLQHAGIPGGLFGLCAHAWLGQPVSAPTYQNWGLVHREWSMLTGAVHATRKSVLELVNGLDERFRLEFNDVDFCLRLRMLGYRNVYTPFAELIHHEKASRGDVLPRGSELALFWKRWSEFLEQDPAYHPRLARDSFRVAPVEQIGEWWQGR